MSVRTGTAATETSQRLAFWAEPWSDANGYQLAATLTSAVIATCVIAWLVRRGVAALRASLGGGLAVPVAALAAVACTAYTADTSWRFAAHYLGMGSTAERVAMFFAAELALLATALMARQNLNGPTGAPGVPGALVWVITGVQIIPAYAESGLIGGTVRAFVGPVMAAMLWHLAMGIELRHRQPTSSSRSLAALVGGELKERLLSRLGLSVRDRDAAQISRDRATAQAVAYAARLAEMSAKRKDSWRGRRVGRRLSLAVARAQVGTEAAQRRQLMHQLAARRYATALATIPLPSPWDAPDDGAASALSAQTRQAMRRATDSIRQDALPSVLFADVAPAQAVDTEVNSAQSTSNAYDVHPRPDPQPEPPNAEPQDALVEGKLGTDEARSVIERGWRNGWSVRDTATKATRAPSFVHRVFTQLDDGSGPRPVNDQLSLVNGHGLSHSEAPQSR